MVNVSAVIATAVNIEGRREIVGFDIVTTESTVAWTGFLRSLVARGLAGWSWSSPTLTAGSKRRSRRCSVKRRGSVAEPIMPTSGLCRCRLGRTRLMPVSGS